MVKIVLLSVGDVFPVRNEFPHPMRVEETPSYWSILKAEGLGRQIGLTRGAKFTGGITSTAMS